MLLLRLLLTATCLLLTADFSRALSRHRVVTCDDASVHRLTCNIGVIIVQTALYGRADGETCSEDASPQQLTDTKCSQEGTLGVIKKWCDGRKVCDLNRTLVHPSDPCPGISKYLDTTHSCVPTRHVTACEHSITNLHCDGGQSIFVYGANYGRHSHTICADERPYPEIQNTYCSNPKASTQKVAESCNGKSSCAVKASSSVFGDPCVGTHKYLAAAFRCQFQTVVCEDSEASLECGEGQVLFVYGAAYGRRDRTTCASGRSESEIQNVQCSRFSSKVADSCEGKNSCVISASSEVFGDPCVGTYKYLAVGYTCHTSSERWAA